METVQSGGKSRDSVRIRTVACCHHVIISERKFVPVTNPH